MPVPALVIGLGGSGTTVATYVKKELMESTQNWPLKEVRILAFDTDTDAAKDATIGASGQTRTGGLTTGGVRLREGGEFFYIGGNVKALVEQVAQGQHRHIGRWFQAETYLKDLSLPDNMYNLNVGAGQFRQFGRMAIFKDMIDASSRRVFNTLSDALTRIKQQNPALTNLQVFIIGSVAGGTGAGMFADVAHLVRSIAGQPNIQLQGKISIRGYLILPDAFSQTVQTDVLKEMHARAYAAMRENRRFTINFDYERGYPMPYRESGTDPIWTGGVKGQLFDLLYYIDGQGGQAATTALKYGVAPAIADAISAAVDGDAGPAFSSYVVNVKAVYAGRIARGVLPRKAATFGSLGTYSIVFPIYHIVEGWAHDLGKQMLDHLLSPTEFDPRSGTPTTLATNQNPEEPNEDGNKIGFEFLNSQQAISFEYVDADGNTRSNSVEPTLLPQQLFYIASHARRGSSSILPELIERRIEDWQAHFMPEGQDDETRRLLDRVKTTLNSRLYHPKEGGEVMATDQVKQKQQEEMDAAADRIERGVRAYKNRYLGAPSRQGRRSGGLYRKALDEIVAYQMERFIQRLDLFMLATLNGSANNPQSVAKRGKVGFLATFLHGLFTALELTRAKLQEAQEQRRELGEGYLSAAAKAESARQNMLDASAKKGLFSGRSATNAQHTYLQAEVELIDMLKVETTEEAILSAVTQMMDYVRSAEESLQAWIDSLAQDTKSLYRQVLDGRTYIDNDRRAIQDVKVRLVVTDPDYENARYQTYLDRTDGGWINRQLGQVQWRIKHRKVAGQPKVELGFSLGNSNEDRFVFGLDTPEENLTQWLNLCRQPFQRAYDEESVLSYLIQHRQYRQAGRLAEDIHGNSGIMLNVAGGDPLPANFLRAYYLKDSEAGQADYLRGVVDRIAGLSGFSISQEDLQEATYGDENGQISENKFVRFVNSEDRFKLTFVFTQELIELDNIVSYRNTGYNEYVGTIHGNRSILHVFPAEVNAARYEARLGELKQPIRLFDNEVTLQLEDLSRVKLFLLCYVYGLIRRDSVVNDTTGERLNLWKLFLEPEKQFDAYGNPTITEEIYLTEPQSNPHILDALATFNYEEKDARFKQGYVTEINYAQVVEALRRAREKDVAQRLEAGVAGQHSQDLLGQIDTVDADIRQSVLEDLAQIDRIREYQRRVEKEILPILEKRKTHITAEQRDYDMMSTFVLMLNDEIQGVRKTVQNRLSALRNLGPTGSQTPSPSQSDASFDPWNIG